MKTIKEYWILENSDPHILAMAVQKAIEKGAQPYGSFICERDGSVGSGVFLFVQPMVKYAEAPSFNPVTGEKL